MRERASDGRRVKGEGPLISRAGFAVGVVTKVHAEGAVHREGAVDGLAAGGQVDGHLPQPREPSNTPCAA